MTTYEIDDEPRRTYSTRADAVLSEIVEPIEASGFSADEYDLDAIQEEVLGDYEDGYACKVTIDEFWQIVEKHEKEPRRTYETLLEAVIREIVEPLHGGGVQDAFAEYNVDEIAHDTITQDPETGRYECSLGVDTFWDEVQGYMRVNVSPIQDGSLQAATIVALQERMRMQPVDVRRVQRAIAWIEQEPDEFWDKYAGKMLDAVQERQEYIPDEVKRDFEDLMAAALNSVCELNCIEKGETEQVVENPEYLRGQIELIADMFCGTLDRDSLQVHLYETIGVKEL